MVVHVKGRGIRDVTLTTNHSCGVEVEATATRLLDCLDEAGTSVAFRFPFPVSSSDCLPSFLSISSGGMSGARGVGSANGTEGTDLVIGTEASFTVAASSYKSSKYVSSAL
jgi:hypothetical protein